MRFTNINITDKEIRNKLLKCKNKANFINDVIKITNTFLSNSAYHDKNIAKQLDNFNKLNVPQDELDLVSDLWELKNDIAKSLMIDVRDLIEYGKNLKLDNKKLDSKTQSMKDIHNEYKEKIKNKILEKCKK